MKKTYQVILSIALIVSSLVFTTSLFIDSASKEISNQIVYHEVETAVESLVSSIGAIIPINTDEAVDDFITKLKEDPKVSATVDKYSRLFVSDLSHENMKPSVDLNTEVQALLLEYSNEIGALFGDIINPVYKEKIIRAVIERIDFNQYYEAGLSKVRTSMSPSQLRMTKIANLIFENTALVRIVSLIVLVTVILLLFKSLFILSIGFFLSGMIHALMWLLLPNRIPFELNYIHYMAMALVFFVLSLVSFTMSKKTVLK